VRRCRAGINSEAIGNGAETAKPPASPINSRRAISCSPVCTSGISSVKNVIPAVPMIMIVLRLKWSEIAEHMKPPTTIIIVEATARKRISPGARCSGCLASTKSEPVMTRS
jgi:hypothetical protein